MLVLLVDNSNYKRNYMHTICIDMLFIYSAWLYINVCNEFVHSKILILKGIINIPTDDQKKINKGLLAMHAFVYMCLSFVVQRENSPMVSDHICGC